MTKKEKEELELKNMKFVRPVLFGYQTYGPVSVYPTEPEVPVVPAAVEVAVATEPKMK